MDIFRFLFLIGASFTVLGCNVDQGIKNDALRQRVVACGAGYSDEVVENLDASYVTHAFEGKINNTFKNQAKEMIFLEVPPQDRLKAYEDYIKCIESKPFPVERNSVSR